MKLKVGNYMEVDVGGIGAGRDGINIIIPMARSLSELYVHSVFILFPVVIY